MTNNTLKKIPFLQKIRYSIVGAIASVAFVLIPAYAVVAVVEATQFNAMIAQMVNQVKNSADQITLAKAQELLMKEIDKAQQKLLNDLHAKANTLADGLKGKLQNAVTDKLGVITGGPVGKLLTNAGLSMNNVSGPGVAGHIDPKITERQLTEVAAVKNPVDAIATQTKIMLENQLHDRFNVSSVLNEKPASGNCTTTSTNCTILTRLREYDAVALNNLQKINFGAIRSQVEQEASWAATLLQDTYKLVGTTTINVLAFLTPSQSIALGFEPNPATAANLEKSALLAQIMIGAKNDAPFLAKQAQDNLGGDAAKQLNAMSKIAKVQLARGAIMNVHNEAQQASFNAQFRACVVRPDPQDSIAATAEQQLVNIQSLLRCGNMIQLQQRQQDLETQRLLGTMLLTLLDLYAVQEPGKPQ